MSDGHHGRALCSCIKSFPRLCAAAYPVASAANRSTEAEAVAAKVFGLTFSSHPLIYS